MTSSQRPSRVGGCPDEEADWHERGKPSKIRGMSVLRGGLAKAAGAQIECGESK